MGNLRYFSDAVRAGFSMQNFETVTFLAILN